MAPPLVAKQYTLRGKDQSALHSLEGETKRFQYKVRGALSQYVNNGHFYTDFKNICAKMYVKAHLVFADVCRSCPANMPEKVRLNLKCFYFLFFWSQVPR